jgi:hypothetical protein
MIVCSFCVFLLTKSWTYIYFIFPPIKYLCFIAIDLIESGCWERGWKLALDNLSRLIFEEPL